MRRFPFLLSLSISVLAPLVACGPKADSGEDTADTGDVIDSGDTGDTGTEIPDVQPPSPAEFQALVDDAREQLTQTFTAEVGHYTQIQGDQGTTVIFSSNSLVHADGSPVYGVVNYELIEIYSKGEMLVADLPSTGRLPNGDIAQLISGGEHFVNATQNGEDLVQTSWFYLAAPAENTGGVDEEMVLFRPEQEEGLEDDASAGEDFADGAWVEAGDDAEFGIDKEGRDGENGSVAEGYWMLSSEFGWTNIDRWYSDPRPKTEIHVDVPAGWDDTNSAVYLSYDGEPTALAQMDTYDETTELFSEHYGLIPIGLEVHLIFVTESEGDWSYAIQGETIQDGHLTVFDAPESFLSTDLEGLTAAINALP